MKRGNYKAFCFTSKRNKKISELNRVSFKSELYMVNSHNLIPLKVFLLVVNTNPVKISKLNPFWPMFPFYAFVFQVFSVGIK